MSEDKPTDGTTPRPWRAVVDEERGDYGSVLSRYLDRIEGADGRTAVRFVDDFGTDQSADAALIVAAVNDYDRLLIIEAAARAYVKAADRSPNWTGNVAMLAAFRALRTVARR